MCIIYKPFIVEENIVNKIATLLQKIDIPRQYLSFLALLLSGDAFFVLLHLTHKAARILNVGTTIRQDVFNLSMDLSLAESYQYVKEFWIIILLAWVIIKNRRYAYLGWTFLFSYLVLDDMLSFHEGLGTLILNALHVDPNFVLTGELRYQDFGELAVSVFFGLLFLTLIGLAYWRGGKKLRTSFHYILAGLLVTVFFGVFFDFADRIFSEDTSKVMYELTRLLEDGGEMLGMTLTCWYVYTFAHSPELQG